MVEVSVRDPVYREVDRDRSREMYKFMVEVNVRDPVYREVDRDRSREMYELWWR